MYVSNVKQLNLILGDLSLVESRCRGVAEIR
jgi:hypothetical protein